MKHDDEDLPGLDQQRPAALLQGLSPAVVKNDPPGARPGNYLVRLGDEQVLLAKFTCMMVGWTERCPEYLPDAKVEIADHGRLPPDASFHKAGGAYPRGGHYRPNGNAVVPTFVVLLLIDHNGQQYPSALTFQRSSHAIGRDLYGFSRRLKATVAGQEVRGCDLGKFVVSAIPDPKSGRGNYVPKVDLLGVVGQEAGPSLAEYAYASEARRWFKAGNDFTLLEPSLPKAAPTRVAIEAESPPVAADDDTDMVPEGFEPDDPDHDDRQ